MVYAPGSRSLQKVMDHSRSVEFLAHTKCAFDLQPGAIVSGKRFSITLVLSCKSFGTPRN